MERWQILYLGVVIAGFLVGWFFDPVAAVAFVWICIIISESVNYWKEMKEFEQGSEEA